MAEMCNCGARLPSGASFCPNCGRPLEPGYAQERVRPEPKLTRQQSVRSGTIPDYLRAAVVPAACAVAFRIVASLAGPVMGAVAIAAMIPAGGVAVKRLSRSITPVTSAWQGFGVGALTGLLCFLPSLVVQVVTHVAQGREPMLEMLQQQASPMAGALMSALEDPAIFALVIILGLFVEACGLVVVAGAGGSLAAWAESRAAA